MSKTKKINFNRNIKRKTRHRNKIKFIFKKTKKKHTLSGGMFKKSVPNVVPDVTYGVNGIEKVKEFFEEDEILNEIEYAIILKKIVTGVGKARERLFILFKNSDDDIQDSKDDSDNKDDNFFPLVEYCLCYYNPTKKNKIGSPLKKLKLYRFKTNPVILDGGKNIITFLYKVGRFESMRQSNLSLTRTYNLEYEDKSVAETFLKKLKDAYDETLNPTIDTFLYLIRSAKSDGANNDDTIDKMEEAVMKTSDDEKSTDEKSTDEKSAANREANLSAEQTSNKSNRDIALGVSYVGFFASVELFRNTANIIPISAAIASLAAGVAMQVATIWENDILVKQSYNRVHNLIKYIIEPLQVLESMNKHRSSTMKINSIEIIVYLLMLLRKCKAWKKRAEKGTMKRFAIFFTVYPSIYNNKIINICNKLEETIVLMSQILSIHVNINVLKLDEKIDILLKNQKSSDNSDDSNNTPAQ